MEEKLFRLLDISENSGLVSRAEKIDSMTSFLTDKVLSASENPYITSFQNKAKALLNNDVSFNKFTANLSFPIEINSLTSEIYNKISKIWDGQNRSISTSPDTDDMIIDFSFYQQELFSYYFNRPNTLLTITPDGKAVLRKLS